MVSESRDNFDAKRFERAMKEAPEKLFRELKKRVTPYLLRWVRRDFAGKRFVRGKSQGGPLLHRRTGALSRSFNVAASGATLEALQWVTGSFGNKTANLHEFGGTITAKRTKYLAIPLDAAKTAAGVAKGPPRSFPNTFFIPRRGGGFIMQALSADEHGLTDVVPLFKLQNADEGVISPPADEGHLPSVRRPPERPGASSDRRPEGRPLHAQFS